MTKYLSAISSSAVVVVVLFAAVGFAPGPRDGVLSVLKPGIPVSLSDTASGYELGLFPQGPDMLGYKVLEVGTDFVVLGDIAGIKELRMPLYSIKSVITTKLTVVK